MNLFSALALLFGATVKNRVRRQIQRLRQPRFLIATLAGLVYFWQLIFRRWMLFTQPVADSPLRELVVGQLRPLAEVLLISLALVQILGAWAFGDERAQLAFTEAEVQFFFPAPASRLSLVHYKLLRGMAWLVFGAIITAAIIGRALSHRPLLFTSGAWVGLTAIYLHRIASSFTRERLAARGLWGRAVVWGVLAAVLLALFGGGWRTLQVATVPLDAEPLAWVAGLTQQILNARPVSWVLAPVRALVRLALAPDGRTFLRALPAALVVLVVQYLWVIATVTPFEEASAEAAEVRGRMLEARRNRTGTSKSITFRRSPFTLAGTGRPEIALAWKNVLAVIRQFEARGMVVLLLMAIALVMALRLAGGAQEAKGVLGPMMGTLVVMVVLIGPIRLSLDLRHDVGRIDMLRALPLDGVRIVLAEMLAPAVLLGAIEWLMIGVGVALGGDLGNLGFRERASLGLALALVAPPLTWVGLVLQNAAALLFPDWMTVFRERRRGFDAMGQRLLTIAGSAIVIAVGAIPAAMVGGIVTFVLWGPLQWLALPIAAVVAAVALTVEVLLGALWVGRLFETHDVSQA